MRFQCPFCRGIVAVDNTRIGQDVQCGHCDEVITVPASRLASGAVIADFIIIEELGRGGMGVVYMAHQISLDRQAALKILQDNYASNAEFVVNFIKEARCAAKLNHPHIVQAYAVGEDEGIYYFAMEYIDGETMKNVLRREKILAIDKAVAIIQQIAEALDCAWKEQKLIHRDIKPDNIMLTKNGRAKLADLGLSRIAGEVDDEDDDEVMGTPQYISPEHLTGAPMDVRSDIYSLGATFYQFVTGRFPYEGKNANEIAKQHLDGILVPPQVVNPQIPEAISNIIMKMMKKNPSERYQDAEALVDDLKLFSRGKGTSGLSMPKAFSTHTQAVPRAELRLPGKAPLSPGTLQMPEVPTTTTGSLKPLYTATTTTSSGLIFSGKTDEGLRTKPKKKSVVWLLIVIALFVVAAGSAIWFFVVPLIKVSKASPKSPDAASTPAAKPESKINIQDSEYAAKIDKILQEYNKVPGDGAKLLAAAADFIEKNPQPDTAVQKNKFNELMQAFSPLDEKRADAIRKKLRDDHLQQIQNNKKAAEAVLVERRKQEEVKKRQEAEEQERKRKNAEEKLQNEKRIADYVKVIKNKMNNLAKVFVVSAKNNDAVTAEAAFNEAISEPGRLVGVYSARERDEAAKLVDYAKKLQAGFAIGWKMNTLLTNSGTELEGQQIEFRVGSLGRIKKIEGGTITVIMMSADAEEEIKISDLPSFFLNKFIQRLEKKQQIINGYFFYMVFTCNFSPELAALAPDEFWKKELSNLELLYFKEKLGSASEAEKKELETRFGNMESFKKALSNIPKT